MRMSSEKYSLLWSNFKDNIQSSLKDFKDNGELYDITLACKDGHNIEAHKNQGEYAILMLQFKILWIEFGDE